jgi:hypothetical protein
MRRIDDLANIDLDNSEALAEYLRRLNRLYKDLTMEVGYSSDEILENLASVPGHAAAFGVDSRIRAKWVVSPLVKARESTEYAGGQIVRANILFRKYFAPELEKAETGRKPAKPKFSWT